MTARGKQTALMPGNEDKVGYWLTPPPLMAALQAEFGPLEDVCPHPRPAGWDALREPWPPRSYVNPPFGGGAAWVRKAVHEVGRGSLVVLVQPARHLQTTVREFVRCEVDRPEVRLVNPHWHRPDGRVSPWTAPAVIFILRPKP